MGLTRPLPVFWVSFGVDISLSIVSHRHGQSSWSTTWRLLRITDKQARPTVATVVPTDRLAQLFDNAHCPS